MVLASDFCQGSWLSDITHCVFCLSPPLSVLLCILLDMIPRSVSLFRRAIGGTGCSHHLHGILWRLKRKCYILTASETASN